MPLATSNPTAGRAIGAAPKVTSAVQQDPRQAVSSYVNQQLGGLIAGTSPTVGPAERASLDISTDPFGNDDRYSLSPVARIHQQGAQRMQESIQRTNVYKAEAARKKALGGTAGRQFGATGNIANAGKAWKTNGSLSDSRNRALQLASSYLGSRYVLGGTTYRGIDCSGLVMMVYNQLGYKLNHSAGQQGRNIPGVRTQNLGQLRPGDLIAWKDGSHIAIYAGNGEIIEAANPRVGTVRRRLWASPSQVYGIMLRLPGE